MVSRGVNGLHGARVAGSTALGHHLRASGGRGDGATRKEQAAGGGGEPHLGGLNLELNLEDTEKKKHNEGALIGQEDGRGIDCGEDSELGK